MSENTIKIRRLYKDSEIITGRGDIEDETDSFAICAYLNPENIFDVEARIENNPISKRPISTNKIDPYIRIYPGETVVVPIGVHINVPYSYSLYLEADEDLVINKRIDLIYNQIFSDTNGNDCVLLQNRSGNIKNLSHNDLIANVTLIKNEFFTIQEK